MACCGTYVARRPGLPRCGPSVEHRKLALTCGGMMRAGDGNRNRMTSLEGFGVSSEVLRIHRSAAMLACP
jgi:hypothetical protein